MVKGKIYISLVLSSAITTNQLKLDETLGCLNYDLSQIIQIGKKYTQYIFL